jgi:tRNA dimethylallyltransferase
VSELKPIPIICGPTGSGKTEIAIELAKQFPVEIVSADSRQIIKHLNIGTAKPTAAQQQRVPFHLIDIIEPGERYSAFRFIDDANQAIADILQRRRIPVVVGGTGLYLRALTEGVVEIEKDDLSIRQQLEEEMERLGQHQMYDRLLQVDPLEAAKLHPKNKVRVIRALEIYYLTGKSKSEFIATESHRKSPHCFEYFCLIPQRQALYSAIDTRADRMMQHGLMDELQQLCRLGLKERIRKANVIGYNELLDHLDGKFTLSEAVGLIRQNSRRYAKRQITWFRHQLKGNVFAEKISLMNGVEKLLPNWSRGR